MNLLFQGRGSEATLEFVPFVGDPRECRVLMAGVAGWGPDGGAWSPAHMARAYHEALGVPFHSADPQKYLDALLYGLNLA